jgi:hypothetical protein
MKILAILLLLFLANTSLAQENTNPLPTPNFKSSALFTRAPCDPLPTMVETISKYKEELLFMGDGMTFSGQTGQPFNGGMMFFVNQETGTWSMLQLFADGMACMVMNGRKFQPYTGPSNVKKDKL